MIDHIYVKITFTVVSTRLILNTSIPINFGNTGL